MHNQVLIDLNDQMRFLNTAIDENGKSKKIDAKAMTGKEIENLLKEFGAQFPIKVEKNKVVNDEQEAYMLVNGKKVPISKENVDKMQKAQEEKGLLDSQIGLEH